MQALQFFGYAGVAVFAATGALAASRKQLDVVGFLFLACITGIGGGTLRDIILATQPIFWVANPSYIIVCVTVALITYFTAHLMESRYRWLVWLDAIGLAAYCVMGAAKGLAATGSPVIAIVTGILTAAAGGIIRDVLAGEPCILLRPEIYITAAMAGSLAFTVADLAGLANVYAALIGVAAAFVVRGGALAFGWTIPPYRARPGRHPDDVM